MLVSELAIKQGVLHALRSRLTEDEFNNTMNEGWVTEGGFEAEMFEDFSTDEKKLYALSYARSFSQSMLNKTVEEFDAYFGDYYSDTIDLEEIYKEEAEEETEPRSQREFTKADRAIMENMIQKEWNTYFTFYMTIPDNVMGAIIDDIKETSAWGEQGHYNSDDVHMSCERVIMNSLVINCT